MGNIKSLVKNNYFDTAMALQWPITRKFSDTRTQGSFTQPTESVHWKIRQ